MAQVPPALSDRRFALFWVGLIFAWMGYFIQQWTILWHIRTLTAEPLAFGYVGLVRVVAILVTSLLAGVAADVFPRRSLVIATQMLMGAVSLALGILSISRVVALWQIYLLIGVQAAAFSFELPARQSMVPNLVSAAVVGNAFSLETIGYQIGAFLGPTMSGLFIDRLGIASSYLAGGAATSIMVLMLFLIGSVKQEARLAIRKGLQIDALREGITFTFRQPLIFSGMILDFLATLFVRADTLMPIIAKDILGFGPVAYGWLSAAQSIGATVAGIFLSMQPQIRRQGAALLGAVLMVGVGTIGFGVSRQFAITMAALMLIGASDSVSAIIRNTIRQLHTPDQIRGRMTSVNQVFFNGGPQLGELKSGILGGWLGVPTTIAVGGIACVLLVGWAVNKWPVLRNYSYPEAVGIEQP